MTDLSIDYSSLQEVGKSLKESSNMAKDAAGPVTGRANQSDIDLALEDASTQWTMSVPALEQALDAESKRLANMIEVFKQMDDALTSAANVGKP